MPGEPDFKQKCVAAAPAAKLRFARSVSKLQQWGEQDSNLRRRKPTDLQSVPFGHFGIPPFQPPADGSSTQPCSCFEAICLPKPTRDRPKAFSQHFSRLLTTRPTLPGPTDPRNLKRLGMPCKCRGTGTVLRAKTPEKHHAPSREGLLSHSVRTADFESQRRDSNPRPAVYKTAALPTELRWRWNGKTCQYNEIRLPRNTKRRFSRPVGSPNMSRISW